MEALAKRAEAGMRQAPRRHGRQAAALAQRSADEARHAVLTIRVDFGVCGYLGPGKIALMELISKHGSISAAGKEMRMSYRRAWLLVDTMNRMFACPLVETVHGGARGGGAKLTGEGREILALYRAMEQQFRQSCAAKIDALNSRANSAPRVRKRA